MWPPVFGAEAVYQKYYYTGVIKELHYDEAAEERCESFMVVSTQMRCTKLALAKQCS